MENKEKKFAEIVMDYQDKIYRLCWSYIRDPEDRKDLFQTILIKIWKNLNSLQNSTSLNTWIYRISVNTSIDFLRRDKKLTKQMSPLDISDINLTDNTKDVEHHFIQSETYQCLQKCINRLSVIDKTLLYFYLEDLKYQEIAEIIGTSEKNISVKLVRIKKLLRDYLEDFEA